MQVIYRKHYNKKNENIVNNFIIKVYKVLRYILHIIYNPIIKKPLH